MSLEAYYAATLGNHSPIGTSLGVLDVDIDSLIEDLNTLFDGMTVAEIAAITQGIGATVQGIIAGANIIKDNNLLDASRTRSLTGVTGHVYTLDQYKTNDGAHHDVIYTKCLDIRSRAITIDHINTDLAAGVITPLQAKNAALPIAGFIKTHTGSLSVDFGNDKQIANIFCTGTA